MEIAIAYDTWIFQLSQQDQQRIADLLGEDELLAINFAMSLMIMLEDYDAALVAYQMQIAFILDAAREQLGLHAPQALLDLLQYDAMPASLNAALPLARFLGAYYIAYEAWIYDISRNWNQRQWERYYDVLDSFDNEWNKAEALLLNGNFAAALELIKAVEAQVVAAIEAEFGVTAPHALWILLGCNCRECSPSFFRRLWNFIYRWFLFGWLWGLIFRR